MLPDYRGILNLDEQEGFLRGGDYPVNDSSQGPLRSTGQAVGGHYDEVDVVLGSIIGDGESWRTIEENGRNLAR